MDLIWSEFERSVTATLDDDAERSFMSAQNILYAVTIALMSAACAPRPQAAGEFAYATDSVDDNVVLVFNTQRNKIAQMGRDYLSARDGKYMEFVGHLIPCSDHFKHCYSEAFPVSVPRVLFKISRWESEGGKCKVTDIYKVEKRRIFKFVCSYDHSPYSTEFWYSRSRGIESFKSTEPGEPKFTIVDEVGIFAE